MDIAYHPVSLIWCTWLSSAALFIPGSGVADAYAASADLVKETGAISIYFTSWMIVIFLFLCTSLLMISGAAIVETHVCTCSIGPLRKSIGFRFERALFLAHHRLHAPCCR
ncbi:hypothetical protein BC834DRAFT_611540 [Gloeopeniophorella convolvens]|nr:hypothetical protein BC834DRAFT_611540 [Gloeopeniophorella convolvens]